MLPEEFFSVPGFTEVAISKSGTVRLTKIRRGKQKIEILKPSIKHGHLMVNVRDSYGKHHYCRVKNLMSTTFLGPIPKNMYIHNIDGDRSNCTISNLKYITYEEKQKFRFWEKVNRNGNLICKTHEAAYLYPEIVGTCCFEWTGSLDTGGYGLFKFENKIWKAHKYSYRLHGFIDDTSDCLCHKCNNTKCINPLHLKPGTFKDNMKDREASGRTAKGNRNGRYTHPESRRCKFSTEDVSEIRRLYNLTFNDGKKVYSLRQIAKMYNSNKSYIGQIARGNCR